MKTILFLDIDGVFSIPDPAQHDKRLERLSLQNGQHIVCWPIPLYRQIISAIGQERQLHPVWLSAWGDAAHVLTNRAMTQAFPVAYPLSAQKWHYARQRFPESERVDKKLVAAVYYLRARRYDRVIWMEDGFTEETRAWASKNAVRLIDTTEEAVKALLLSEEEQAVQEVLNLFR